MKKRPGLAVGLLATLAAVSTSLAPAGAAPNVPPASTASTEAASVLTLQDEAAVFTNHWNESGYGDVAVDQATNTITVKWSGTVPDTVTAEAEEAPAGVTVNIEPVPYSAADLTAAADAVVQNAIDNGDRDLIDVTAATDLSGITTDVVAGSRAAATPAATRRHYAAVSHGVPVQVQAQHTGRPIPLSRHNSAAPWKGGAEINHTTATTQTFCTSGFALLTSSGQGRVLTAAHCGAGGTTWTDGTGETIGSVVSRQRADTDSMLIDPNASPATTGVVFGGPWDATTLNARYQLNVGASSAPSTGDSVCMDGAMSGEHCNRTIVATNVAWDCGAATPCNGFRVGDLISTNSVTLAEGDSGGPVYVNRSDGKVGARGMIEAGAGQVPCGSTAWTTTCFNIGYVVGITRITSQWGVTVETN